MPRFLLRTYAIKSDSPLMILTDDGAAAAAGRPRGAEGEDREVARDADLVHQHSQLLSRSIGFYNHEEGLLLLESAYKAPSRGLLHDCENRWIVRSSSVDT